MRPRYLPGQKCVVQPRRLPSTPALHPTAARDGGNGGGPRWDLVPAVGPCGRAASPTSELVVRPRYLPGQKRVVQSRRLPSTLALHPTATREGKRRWSPLGSCSRRWRRCFCPNSPSYAALVSAPPRRKNGIVTTTWTWLRRPWRCHGPTARHRTSGGRAGHRLQGLGSRVWPRRGVTRHLAAGAEAAWGC